jgi:hypothetical protein
MQHEKSYSFAERVGLRGTHRLSPAIFSGRLAALARDGKNMALDCFQRYQSRLGDSAQYALADALDLPLLPEEGGLLGLDLLDEWALQEKLVSQVVPGHSLLQFRFENFMGSRAEELARVLEFAGAARTLEQIKESLQSAAAAPAAEVDWSESQYEPLTARFKALGAAEALPPGFAPASVEPLPAPAWPEEAVAAGTKAWVDAAEGKLSAALGLAREQLLPFRESLERICRCLEQVPLLHAAARAEAIA